MKNRQPTESVLGQTQTPVRADHNYLIFYLLYLLVLIMLIYIIPEDVLNKSPFLNQLINFMKYSFNGVEGLGKYSCFPQQAQFVYSLEIATLPIIALIFYNIFGFQLKVNADLLQHKPIIPIFAMILLCPLALIPFYLFTIPPSAINVFPYRIITDCYHSKIWFVIISAFSFYFTRVNRGQTTINLIHCYHHLSLACQLARDKKW